MLNMIIKSLVFILFLMLGSVAFGSSQSEDLTKGEGRFFSVDGDSLTFIKSQLLYSAICDIMTKELTAMGLDTNYFWEMYEKSFEEYYRPIQADMMKKDGVDSVQKIDANSTLKKKYRSNKLTLKAKFGRLDRIIPQYLIKTNTRSAKYPNSRYMTILAKVNKEMMHTIFLAFTRSKELKHYSRLFLTMDVALKNVTWQELGIESVKDFEVAIVDHWLSYMETLYKQNVEGLMFIRQEDQKEQLKIYSQSGFTVTSNQTSNSAPSVDNAQLYANGMWVKSQFLIEKTGQDHVFSKAKFNVTGSFVYIDLDTKELIHQIDITKTEKEFITDGTLKLGSELATFVYQLPLGGFSEFKQVLSKRSANEKLLEFKITGHQNIQELFVLEEFLTKKGLPLQINVSLVEFHLSPMAATLSMSYKGQDQDLSTMLQSLINQEIENGISISQVQWTAPKTITLKKETAKTDL